MFVKYVNYFKILFYPTSWNREFGCSHHHKNILEHVPWWWIWTFSRMTAVTQNLLSAGPALCMADLEGREIPFVRLSWVLLVLGTPKNPSPLPWEMTLTKPSVHLLSQPSGGSRGCKRDGPKSKQHQEQDVCAPSWVPQPGLKNEFRVLMITEMEVWRLRLHSRSGHGCLVRYQENFWMLKWQNEDLLVIVLIFDFWSSEEFD